MSGVARLRRRLALIYAGVLGGIGLLLLALVASVKSWSTETVAAKPARGAPKPVPAFVTLHHSPLALVVSLIIAAVGVLLVLSALPLGWWLAGRSVGPVRRAFESQSRFIANAAHELRTPVAAERTILQVALADPCASVESLRAACESALAGGRDQERLLEALLTLANAERGLARSEPVDVTAAAGASGERLVVAGDRVLLEVLVGNLLDNAREHNIPGGWVRVSTTRTELVVANSGPVIPASEVAGLFEPFRRFGAERTGEHYGLGLAIVRAIAVAHGGGVEAAPLADGGLKVRVNLAAAARAAEPRRRSNPTTERARKALTHPGGRRG